MHHPVSGRKPEAAGGDGEWGWGRSRCSTRGRGQDWRRVRGEEEAMEVEEELILLAWGRQVGTVTKRK